MTALLAYDRVGKRFPGVVALDEVSLPSPPARFAR
jgi:ABC-type sugar transport system ATPase subunit